MAWTAAKHMYIRVLSAYAILLPFSSVAYTPPTISLVVNAPGSAPYLYFDESAQTYEGVVKDFFTTMEQDGVLTVRYRDGGRNRNELAIYQQKADVFLSSMAWLKHPDLVISGGDFSSNQTYLYATKPFDPSFTLKDLVEGRICTRRYYVYPNLDKQINDRVRRVDTSSQTSAMSMLLNDRCDYAIMNKFNAFSILNMPDFCKAQIYRSPTPTHEVGNTLIFSLNNRDLVPVVNRYLESFKASGAYDKSMEHHITKNFRSCQR